MSAIEVVFEDLLAASRAFRVHGEKFDQIAPKQGPSVPHLNEAAISEQLPIVLKAIGAMHDAVAASMEAHSVKLKRAHDIYVNTEAKNKELIERLNIVLRSPDSIQ